MYQKLTEKIAGKPEERILSYLMLRSLKQAKYSELNDGHFALAATSYTHFTSPIRRYPDLIVHRILKDVLIDHPDRREGEVNIGIGGHVVQGNRDEHVEHAKVKTGSPYRTKSAKPEHRSEGRPQLTGPIPEDELRHIAEDSSMSERRADDAERELMEWKKVKFMEDKIGADFDGLVTSITKFGMFVELNDMFIEGLVPLQMMQGDHFTFNENTRQIIGQRTRKTYSMGDRVVVLVDRIDPVQRKINFAILDELPPTRPDRGKKKGRHKRRK
jgi:ribonuclease R